jgi:tannase/feruloyl esterase
MHAYMSRQNIGLMALTAVLVATGGWLTWATSGPKPGAAPDKAAVRNAAACLDLTKLTLKDTFVSDATILPAKGSVPEYCRVQGAIEKVILFEVGLPTRTWNGKFFYAGGGGYNGTIPSLNDGLSRGYASTGSDTGHRGEHWDASALLNNPQAQVNYAHRGAHLTTVVAKQIVEAYYGRAQDKSYFMGCSNGGKMALMEAQRYPTDFDGIVGGGFVADRSKLMMMYDWTQHVLLGAEIPPRKIPAMVKATLAACDARDGLEDGLIDRPDLCQFDPGVLTCSGADTPDCLTPKQVDAWRKILDGPRNSRGDHLFPGFSPGHENDYAYYITGFGTMHGYPSSNFMYMDSFMRWIAFNPGFDSVRDFNYDTDPPKLERVASVQDAADADLSRFKAHGGKLILYNGWADHSTPPARSVEYFEEVRKTTPGADDFVRLFMPPGLYHCSGGPGPNMFGARGQPYLGAPDMPQDRGNLGQADHDILAALDDWVEKGVAPTRVIATKFKDDNPRLGVVRTRPVCAFPDVARYKGSGSVDDAANFVCGAAQ